MRIVAGEYGGRKLLSPKDGAVRPTSDKVRGAMFNALGSLGVVTGARVLDAFCGSGALGLEALSRGAGHCTFADVSKVSLGLAKDNAQALNATARCDFWLKDMTRCEPQANPAPKFDLVFLDPPYRKGCESIVMERLLVGSWLADDSVLVVECARDDSVQVGDAFSVQSNRVYGETRVMILQLKASI